ncbi:MAG: carbon monoxide dehydrogenase subunit G [Pigmentiphaga sp.]|uniref:CoxG family protein n=1 Tax=Pigmentiphaga sp. TaxID=1977564 RepID=UPI0029AB4948|nr:carbon monoxide dehydrogenase subunit G [Pigmentiphaga sp.]MDX3907483.1 carbon monoxide dehydrogenase subunit G [Pigmentiphaga sp.]
MQLVGEQLVPADQQTTWAALNDPEILRQCIPGCDAITEDGEHAYRVDMAVRVGPISAKFKGKLRLLDIQAPTAYRLEFEGQGGAAGFGKGTAAVRLAPEAGATRLTYTVDASIGGKLAQVGARLIEAAARKLSDEFFGKFNALMQPDARDTQGLAEPAPDQSGDSVPRWKRLFRKESEPS